MAKSTVLDYVQGISVTAANPHRPKKQAADYMDKHHRYSLHYPILGKLE